MARTKNAYRPAESSRGRSQKRQQGKQLEKGGPSKRARGVEEDNEELPQNPSITHVRRATYGREYMVMIEEQEGIFQSDMKDFCESLLGFVNCMGSDTWIPIDHIKILSGYDIKRNAPLSPGPQPENDPVWSLEVVHLATDANSDCVWARAGQRNSEHHWIVNFFRTVWRVGGPAPGAEPTPADLPSREFDFSTYAGISASRVIPSGAVSFAQTLYETFVQLYKEITSNEGYGTLALHVRRDLPLGVRQCHGGPLPLSLRFQPAFPVAYRQSTHNIPCALAALLNSLERTDPGFAMETLRVAREDPERRLFRISKLKQLASNMLALKPRFRTWESYQIAPCLPAGLRHVPIGHQARTQWILDIAQNRGNYILNLKDSDGDSSHVIAIVSDIAGRRMVLDHMEEEAMPLSLAALERCIDPFTSLVGVCDVREVVHPYEVRLRRGRNSNASR